MVLPHTFRFLPRRPLARRLTGQGPESKFRAESRRQWG